MKLVMAPRFLEKDEIKQLEEFWCKVSDCVSRSQHHVENTRTCVQCSSVRSKVENNRIIVGMHAVEHAVVKASFPCLRSKKGRKASVSSSA